MPPRWSSASHLRPAAQPVRPPCRAAPRACPRGDIYMALPRRCLGEAGANGPSNTRGESCRTGGTSTPLHNAGQRHACVLFFGLRHLGSIMVGHRYWMPPPRQFQPMFQVSISKQLLWYTQSVWYSLKCTNEWDMST